jgi:hypothetical protein
MQGEFLDQPSVQIVVCGVKRRYSIRRATAGSTAAARRAGR